MQHQSHLERYVQAEWPQLQRELEQVHRWRVLTEPHWTAPGTVEYWHNAPRTTGENQQGEPVAEEFWAPVSLPAASASVIAHYLDKGFLLAPPDRPSVAKLPPEPSVADPRPSPSLTALPAEPRFFCQHGSDRFAFTTWEGYLNHCNNRGEPVDGKQVSPEIEARAARYPYYCLQHNLGFDSREAADRHYREALRRPGPARHLPVDQMQHPGKGNRRPQQRTDRPVAAGAGGKPDRDPQQSSELTEENN